jgi:hypothetical protein
VFDRRLVWSACGGEEKVLLLPGFMPWLSSSKLLTVLTVVMGLVPCYVWQSLVSMEYIGALVNVYNI